MRILYRALAQAKHKARCVTPALQQISRWLAKDTLPLQLPKACAIRAMGA